MIDVSVRPLSPDALDDLRGALVAIAEEAGRLALGAWRRGARAETRVIYKDGGSPVTDMDFMVDAHLHKALAALRPGWQFHSEEVPEGWSGATDSPAFVVDPLDGTRNFIEGGDEWCVVIGVVQDGVPMAGVVHVPARGETFSAAIGRGAYLDGARLPVVAFRPGPCSAIGPRMMIDQFAQEVARSADMPIVPGPRIHALAHRLAMIARGDHAIALARPGAHDWDIVASDCILREAGCVLKDHHGHLPLYALRGGAHDALIAGEEKRVGKLLGEDTADRKSATRRKSSSSP